MSKKDSYSDSNDDDTVNLPKASFASILLLGAPKGLFMGLDYCQWKITHRFMGISNIPQGAHYLYWDYTSNSSPTSFCNTTSTDFNTVSIDERNASKSFNSSKIDSSIQSYYQRLENDRMNDTRCGCFLYFMKGEVLTWRWDDKSGSFHPLLPEEHLAYADGVKHGDFLGNLAPLQEQFVKPWKELTYFITPSLVNQLEPIKKIIQSSQYNDTQEELQNMNNREGRLKRSSRNRNQKINSDSLHEDKISIKNDVQKDDFDSSTKENFESDNKSNPPFYSSFEKPPVAPSLPYGSSIFYSDIPLNPRLPHDTSPHQRTIQEMDSSTRLELMISKSYQNDARNILGELEFSYIVFLLGYHFDSFQQWKKLLILLCNAESAVKTKPALFTGFFSVFHAQLKQAPDDLFTDELLADNFLLHCIINLLEITEYPNFISSSLKEAAYPFVQFVEKKFGVSIEQLITLSSEGPVIC